MIKLFKAACLSFTLATVTGTSAMSASACNEMRFIALQGSEDSELAIKLNGALLVRHGGPHVNAVPADLLLEGENLLEMELTTSRADATAKAELFVGCEGAFPEEPGQNPNSLLLLHQDGNGKQSAFFQSGPVPQLSYLKAEPGSDEGLRDAIRKLLTAARKGDVAAYLSLLSPMINDLPLQNGPPPQMIEAMLTDLLSGQFDIIATPDIRIRKILKGRAYQVTTADNRGPITFSPKGSKDGAGFEVTQGAFWIKTSEGWKVFRL
ncbi:hypothetical protein [Kiloniella sp. b19]|uniref:hypothetical protein n=1 Tax=Kiloniella sp. GXU_MW_B19 TaxID=3141326 RepID=UPI0031DFAE18